jgi:hypothetical protein
MKDKKLPIDAINREGLPKRGPPAGKSAPKRPLTRDEINAQMKKAGQKGFAKGGAISRGDGCARKGKTKGRMI